MRVIFDQKTLCRCTGVYIDFMVGFYVAPLLLNKDVVVVVVVVAKFILRLFRFARYNIEL